MGLAALLPGQKLYHILTRVLEILIGLGTLILLSSDSCTRPPTLDFVRLFNKSPSKLQDLRRKLRETASIPICQPKCTITPSRNCYLNHSSV